MSYFYRAFGQDITSNIELPELLPASSSLRGAVGDVAIYGLLPASQARAHNDDSYTFSIPTIAHFELPDSQNIHVYPEPGVPESDIRPFILAHGDSCTAFIGPSGSGKSTLAALYLKHDYQILSDDLCVIQFGEQIRTMPGYPQIKIWQDSADILSISTENLKHVLGRKNKFALPLNKGFCPKSKILKKIVILSNRHCEEAQPTKQSMDCHGAKSPRNDMQHLISLIQNTYRLNFLETPTERVRHLEQCQWIAKSIPIISLSHRVPLDAESCSKLLDLN
jgi:hypothetical protein